MEKKNKLITSRDVDFAQWYTDIISAARLASYSKVKGFIIYEPNGYALWEKMQNVLDTKFKSLGHQNVLFPPLIPESLMKKEGELIAGFAPEVAWVTHGGSNELEERLCFRPTSETLFSDYFSESLQSYRDLPMLYNQWCSVVRWEKETRPFLRGRELVWQEGHTIHETKEEAEKETLQMEKVYQEFFHEYLAIPSIIGKKTDKEKFAGAEYTLTNEALMYNGVALQCGTSHFFGQKFSKAYDIKYLNRNNELEYAYQTSWGTTTRMIGAVIMVHGDDKGLVLPPMIAPRQVVIIPISNDEKTEQLAKEYKEKLSANGITVYVDDSIKSPGFKFAEAEVNGIPVRIEIGKRDLENNQVTLVRRDTLEKIPVSLDDDIVLNVSNLLKDIQSNLYMTAKMRMESMTYAATSLEEIENIMNVQPGFIKAMWCGEESCEVKMKEINGLKSRCLPFEQEQVDSKCVCCGKEAKHLVVWGIQY